MHALFFQANKEHSHKTTMLQLIRDRAQGIIVWTIVGLIIITFALFGLSSYLSGASKAIVATVNGVEITETDFLREYQNMQQRLQQMLGKNYRPGMFDEKAMKQRVLEGLIQRELLNQELEEGGFYVAPQQIASTIQSMPVFQDDSGEFSTGRYRQILTSQRMRPETFEYQLARDIADEHLQNGLKRSAFVTEQEFAYIQQLQNQQRKIGYFTLPLKYYLKNIEISEEEIQAYYEQHGNEFKTPEKVSVDYVELKLEDMAKQIEISDKEIEEFYQRHKDNYKIGEDRRRVRHILITVDKDMDDATARAKIEDIAARLAAGEDFASLAKAESMDPGSAAQGGDLGMISRGMMDKTFEEAAFSLKKGEISKPVRSRFGYHLIRVDAIEKAKLRPLAEVKEQIRKEMQQEQAEKHFYEDIEKLNNLSYEIPDSLTPVAEELGLEIKQSPLFARTGTSGLFSNQNLVAAAFSDEVLKQNRNSELVELSETDVVVMRLRKHQPASQLDLKDVRELIVTQLKDEKARKQANEDAAAAIKQMQAGKAPAEVARAYKRKWQLVGFIGRKPEKDEKLDNVLRKTVFEMPRPQEGKPVFTPLTLANGDAAVAALYEVKPGEPGSDPASLKAEKKQLESRYGELEYSAFMKYLASKATITRNLDLTAEE